MIVKIFINTAVHSSERDVLRKFYEGIEKYFNKTIDTAIEKKLRFLNFDRLTNQNTNSVEFDYSSEYTNCDVAVIFGSWKKRDKGHHIIKVSIVEKSKCFICIETPLLTRTVFGEHKYYRVAVNGFLNGDSYWNSIEKTPERFYNMGLRWNGWKKQNKNSHILVGLQLAGDASLRTENISEWCIDTIKKIRSFSDKTIVLRFHPAISDGAWIDYLDIFKKINFGNIPNIKFSNGREVKLEHDLENAYCTVCHSSGLSIDSIYNGIPVIAVDKGNFAWEISSRFPEDINNIHYAETEIVLQWFANLAYCQWSPQEMRDGQTWLHLLPVIEQVLSDESSNIS